MTDTLWALMRAGEPLQAYDLALRQRQTGDHSAGLARTLVLSLARAGAVDFARRQYVELGLHRTGLAEDLVLGARLLKDAALATSGHRRRILARASGDRYGAVWSGRGDLYSGINLATMRVIAGDRAGAEASARAVLATPGTPSYFDRASRAEAAVVLGDPGQAAVLMREAVTLCDGDLAARAATLRQLSILLAEMNGPTAWLEALRPRAVAHFTGHMFAAQPELEASVAREMAAAIAEASVGSGYGALAAGGDILWAEALLEAGAELNVVLPTPTDDFVRTSVLPFGPAWQRRFETCLAAATSVRHAGASRYIGDDGVLTQGTRLAVGAAVLRAEQLCARAVQLALWDGQGAGAAVGVAADLDYWALSKRPRVVVPFKASRGPRPAPPPMAGTRMGKAMLFVDANGFGGLGDDRVSVFFDAVMGGIARTLLDLAAPPEHVETWGDGVFMVFAAPDAAAEAALCLLEGHRRLNLRAHDLPRGLGLRIGGHYGPTHLRENPILGGRAVVGEHVVVAARIEPNAAPGAAYISEALAGILATLHADRFACGYVGRTAPRRDFAPAAMFHLRRR